jgi:hypothetical protein
MRTIIGLPPEYTMACDGSSLGFVVSRLFFVSAFGLIVWEKTGQFEPPAPLWCLQALLLIQAHEKMFSTRKHHEMAHIFHGAIITVCVPTILRDEII